MNRPSLESRIKRQAFWWTLFGISMSILISSGLFFTLALKDTERQLDVIASAIVLSHRTDILSGDVRAVELQIRKDLKISEAEAIQFLDAQGTPWLAPNAPSNPNPCNEQQVCTNWSRGTVTAQRPIYFDSQGKTLWGYLRIDRVAAPNWSLIFGITTIIICGLVFQSIGIYVSMSSSIRSISSTLSRWAQKLSADPKSASDDEHAPFSEIEPIQVAIAGLKKEIATLEGQARHQGALTTLRGIGHDILNPVARMKRVLGILKMNNTGLGEIDQFKSLESNLRRLSSYAEQLKVIYKNQIGDQEFPTSSINASLEIENLLHELRVDPEVVEKSLTFTSEIQPNCFAQISAPALSRIVENLCGNSVSASSPNSAVHLKIAKVHSVVQIEVSDQGAGIPENILDKIFEPNFTTKMNKGTGLGLFVVKHLSEQFGGSVSVNSSVGFGTKMTVKIPFCEVAVGL